MGISFQTIGMRSLDLTNRNLWLVLVLAAYGILLWQIPCIFVPESAVSESAMAARADVELITILLSLPIGALLYTIGLGWIKNKLIVGLYDKKTDSGFVEAREILRDYFLPVFRIEAISIGLLVAGIMLRTPLLLLYMFPAVCLMFLQAYAVLYRCSVRESFCDSLEIITNHLPALAAWICAFGGFLTLQLLMRIGTNPGIGLRMALCFTDAYIQVFLFAVAMNFFISVFGKVRPDFAQDRMTIF
ncbi:hypothetical protein ACFL1X_02250 [Candidatus Hydrogenedentota bacterium]